MFDIGAIILLLNNICQRLPTETFPIYLTKPSVNSLKQTEKELIHVENEISFRKMFVTINFSGSFFFRRSLWDAKRKIQSVGRITETLDVRS